MSVIDASTKDILFSQVTKKVSTAIGNWVQTLYPNIQRPSCPWCHTKGVELHRCHVGPRKIDIVRAEMDVLWKLSTAMGQMPNMDTFVQRVTERVKQDHTDGLTRIEIACGACNPYFEQMQLTKLVELNQFCGRDRKTMWNIYKKRVDNPNPAKKRRVEPTITNYFRGPIRPHDADNEDDEDQEEDDDIESSSEEEDSEEEDSEEESQHLRTALERMRGPLRPKNRFKNNEEWLTGELQKESKRKWIHTSTLKEIYSAIFRKPAMGHLANDRDWLRSAIHGFLFSTKSKD